MSCRTFKRVGERIMLSYVCGERVGLGLRYSSASVVRSGVDAACHRPNADITRLRAGASNFPPTNG